MRGNPGALLGLAVAGSMLGARGAAPSSTSTGSTSGPSAASAAQSPGAASAGSSSFQLAGQIAGTFPLDAAQTCTAGNFGVDSRAGVKGMSLVLTDNSVAPTTAQWQVGFDVAANGLHDVQSHRHDRECPPDHRLLDPV
jgi:hypothetical protein